MTARRPIVLATFALLAFSAPLFVGLGLTDMRNDESIYSYAVERILETRQWLTPRSIPGDGPFLEKPPLKFWLVAGGMRLGVLPRSDVGMRLLDAVFGAVTFGYVLAIGWRVSGPIAGVVGVLVLFTCRPLVLDHGFRSNNMEAALVLAYAGGLYHFGRWVESRAGTRSRAHAFACAGYFVLGFMTKFVAALFLPMVAVLALLWRREGPVDGWRRWSEWLWPAAAAAAAIVPWFVYQARVNARLFWTTIFGQHVYERLTASLDPDHLEPWHYYFTTLRTMLDDSGSVAIVAAGVVSIAWMAWRGTPWMARVILLWALVPLAVMSLGTSKLFHYAYPYFAPFAIGAGVFAAAAVAFVRQAVLRLAAAEAVPRRAWHSSVASAAGVAVLVPLLPLAAYWETFPALTEVSHPIRAIRDCTRTLIRTKTTPPTGVYLSDPSEVAHPYYYYLRRTGPWRSGREGLDAEARTRLFQPGAQSIVIMTPSERRALRAQWNASGATANGVPLDMNSVAIVATEARITLFLPGPFAACLEPVAAAGGRVYDPKARENSQGN